MGNQIVLPKGEQVSRDNYVAGARFFLYVAEVSKWENGSPRVILSRKRPELVTAIFAENVPEIGDGIINIDKVVRQAWVKTKFLFLQIMMKLIQFELLLVKNEWE